MLYFQITKQENKNTNKSLQFETKLRMLHELSFHSKSQRSSALHCICESHLTPWHNHTIALCCLVENEKATNYNFSNTCNQNNNHEKRKSRSTDKNPVTSFFVFWFSINTSLYNTKHNLLDSSSDWNHTVTKNKIFSWRYDEE